MSKNTKKGSNDELSKDLGRPVDALKHRAILQATRQLLEQIGYSKLTLGAIAKQAGVSRQMLYNRWGGKKTWIVHETLFDNLQDLPNPDNGSFSADIREICTYMVAKLSQPQVGSSLSHLMADIHSDSTLTDEMWQKFISPGFQQWEHVFDRAIQRGEIEAEVDSRLSILTVMTLCQQFLVLRAAAPDEVVEFVVQLLSRSCRKGSPLKTKNGA